MKRRWWLSFLMSLIRPGLGQMYNGQLKKGIILNIIVEIVCIAIASLLIIFYRNQIINLLILGFLFIPRLIVAVDAALFSRRFGQHFSPRKYNKWFYYIFFLIVAGLLISYPLSFFTTKFIFKTYKIPTGAMENTMLVGDLILGNRAIYRGNKSPKNGDIIIFKYPGSDEKDYVKRCVAEPGQTVEIQHKNFFVDGKKGEFIKEVKHVRNGMLSPNISQFAPLSIPSTGDTIFTTGLQIREFLFYKHLIHQENQKKEITAEYNLYIDSILSNDQPLIHYYTGFEKVSFNRVDFNKIDNWVYLSNIFEQVKKDHPDNQIEIRKQIYIDSKPVHKYVVKYDNYFVLGDNRDNSMDSRFWGFVNRNFIKAKVTVVYFSINKNVPFWVRWNRIGKPIK